MNTLVSNLLRAILYLGMAGQLVEATHLMRREAGRASGGGLISLRSINAGLFTRGGK